MSLSHPGRGATSADFVTFSIWVMSLTRILGAPVGTAQRASVWPGESELGPVSVTVTLTYHDEALSMARARRRGNDGAARAQLDIGAGSVTMSVTRHRDWPAGGRSKLATEPDRRRPLQLSD